MPVEVGDRAPEFLLTDQHGQDVSSADFVGRQNLVVVFYPYAFSRVCTGELREIQDRLDELTDERTALVAISCDPMFSLREYADRDGYTFPLLSDFWPHGAVARRYGVFREDAGSPSRATFVVDREGMVRWTVHNDVPEARNLDDYLAALHALR